MYGKKSSNSGSKATPKQVLNTPKGYGGTKNSTYIRPQSK